MMYNKESRDLLGNMTQYVWTEKTEMCYYYSFIINCKLQVPEIGAAPRVKGLPFQRRSRNTPTFSLLSNKDSETVAVEINLPKFSTSTATASRTNFTQQSFRNYDI